MPTMRPVTFRDHFASIFQSAVTEVGRRIAPASPERRTRSWQADILRQEDFDAAAAELMALRQQGGAAPPVDATTNIRRTRGFNLSSTVRSCASIAWRYLEARLSGDASRISRVEEEFKAGTCDPAWLTTISQYVGFFAADGGRREIPYIAPEQAGDAVIRIKNGARIALLADWGTGTGRARDVLEGIRSLAPDILIHLGDVYYSGTPTEYKKAFIDPICEILGPDRAALPVFALSGNHDMYCGGLGYYDCIKRTSILDH